MYNIQALSHQQWYSQDVLQSFLLPYGYLKCAPVLYRELLHVIVLLFHVQYSNGSGRSGVFVVLYSQLERLKTEGAVDIFQGVKTARIQRMGIVENAVSGVQLNSMHTSKPQM